MSYVLGSMMLYLFGVRFLSLGASALTSSRHVAAGIVGFVMSVLLLTSGYTISKPAAPIWTSYISLASPPAYTMEQVLILEFSAISQFTCLRRPSVEQQKTPNITIIIKAGCGINDGRQALAFYSYR